MLAAALVGVACPECSSAAEVGAGEGVAEGRLVQGGHGGLGALAVALGGPRRGGLVQEAALLRARRRLQRGEVLLVQRDGLGSTTLSVSGV